MDMVSGALTLKHFVVTLNAHRQAKFTFQPHYGQNLMFFSLTCDETVPKLHVFINILMKNYQVLS